MEDWPKISCAFGIYVWCGLSLCHASLEAQQVNETLPGQAEVRFSINPTGAVTTDGHVFNSAAGDTIWVNGNFVPWYAWFNPADPAAAPAQYELLPVPPGNSNYSLTVNLSEGSPIALQYKYGIGYGSAGDLGPRDNEAPDSEFHLRVIRTTSGGAYNLPQDNFGDNYHEPFFDTNALNDADLTVNGATNGGATVMWLGRPGAHLQTTRNLIDTWIDVPQTDGTYWTNGFESLNGLVSTTNWSGTGKAFFRIVLPADATISNLVAVEDFAFWSLGGTWNIGSPNAAGSSNAYSWATNFNLGSRYGLVGDYNGDGFIDLGEVQENSSYLYWYWNLNNLAGGWNKAQNYTVFGLSTDLPCAADFNGDGKVDIAVFRNGTWYIAYAPCPIDNFATANVTGNFGASGDIPVPGDFNGDGIADVAVFRPSSATWYVNFSGSNGPSFAGPYPINGLRFGLPGDIPAVGDIDGDGYADLIVYRPSTHQIFVDLHNPAKPTCQGYGNLNGSGSIDLTFTYSNLAPGSFSLADIGNLRPKTMPLPTAGSLNVTLPGWSCIFDGSLNVQQWTGAWSGLGISQVQFFSWMRAHEEINPLGPNWNTWVGDERLWTSKATMTNKIASLQAAGMKAICYAAVYAATPAFASEHPAWEMLDPNTSAPVDYPPGSGYLYLMCVNSNANFPYSIGGVTYTNYRSYLLSQAAAAQKQFNWDGWRWDWYGIPSNYTCAALQGTGNFPSELGDLVNDLNLAIKGVRSNSVLSVLELPNSYTNVPLNACAPIVDQQFLELWPDSAETGSNYSDVYNVVNQAATAYPDKPVSANMYPQTTNFPSGWTQTNIDYQFATCLSAGGYPGAQLVDGTGSFTTSTPMAEVRYANSTLTRIAAWNNFVRAYGGYYYFSSPTYLIRNPAVCSFSVSSSPPGIVSYSKERRNKRTFQMDSLMVNLINYGASGSLAWDAVNAEPSSANASVTITVPAGASLSGAYLISPDLGTNAPTALALTQNGNTYRVTTPAFTLFSTIFFTTPFCTNLPALPSAAPSAFPTYPLQYDLAGNTLNGASNAWPVLDGIASPLELAVNFDGSISSWSFSTNAYYGPTNSDAHSIAVTPSQLLFTTTSEHAIRCALTNFSNFQVAVMADPAATKSWFGFRLYNPPTGQVQNFYYRVGADQTNLIDKVVRPFVSSSWQLLTEDLSSDIIATPAFGSTWSNAVVTGIILGPVAGGNACYDAFNFVK